MNRRELFQLTFLGFISQSCHFSLPSFLRASENSKLYFGYGTDPDSEGKREFGISIVSATFQERIKLKNEIHSISRWEERALSVFIPKFGDESYFQIHLEGLQKFSPAEGNYFYGHGVFDKKRNLFYTTQSRITTKTDEKSRRYEEGFIYVHRLSDFKIIDKFPTYGFDPHDLTIANDELVVCNGGHDSNICFIDLESKQKKQTFAASSPHISFGHIEKIDENHFLIASGSREYNKPCELFLLDKTTGLKAYTPPQGLEDLMRVQLLSILYYKGHIYATCPDTDTLLVWTKEGEFIGGQQIQSASSLAISHELDGVIVGSGNHSLPLHLVQVNKSLIQVQKLDWGNFVTGAHSLMV